MENITLNKISEMTKAELTTAKTELENTKADLKTTLNTKTTELNETITNILSNLTSSNTLKIKTTTNLTWTWDDIVYLHIECVYKVYETENADDTTFDKSFDLNIFANEIKLNYASVSSSISSNDLNELEYLCNLVSIINNKDQFLALYTNDLIDIYNSIAAVCDKLNCINQTINKIERNEKTKAAANNLKNDQVYTYPGWKNWFYRIVKITDKQVICKELEAYKECLGYNEVQRKYIYADKKSYHTNAIRHLNKDKFIAMIVNNSSTLVEDDEITREAE